MKAVLGFLFLLSGLTVGYLVLSGKLPNASITPTPASPPASPSTAVPGHSIGGPQGHSGGGPGHILGLPTMANFADMAASRGGMS